MLTHENYRSTSYLLNASFFTNLKYFYRHWVRLFIYTNYFTSFKHMFSIQNMKDNESRYKKLLKRIISKESEVWWFENVTWKTYIISSNLIEYSDNGSFYCVSSILTRGRGTTFPSYIPIIDTTNIYFLIFMVVTNE